MSQIDYLELRNKQQNNQLWFAELRDGSIIECGLGYVDGEFEADSFEKIASASILAGFNEYINVAGFYMFDGDVIVHLKNGETIHLKEIYNTKHPENADFVLIPKNDIIKTWFV